MEEVKVVLDEKMDLKRTLSLVPKAMFLTKGVGYHKNELTSFELALRMAGISSYNLVKVSSIIPPNCRIVSKNEGITKLSYGEIVFVVMSENKTNEAGRLLSSSIGMAIPNNDYYKDMHGYLAEYNAFGLDKEEAGNMAERIASTMLLTIMGYNIDHGEELIDITSIKSLQKDRIISSHITQSAIGRANGIWTTVVAAAVFLL